MAPNFHASAQEGSRVQDVARNQGDTGVPGARTNGSASQTAADWWRQATFYQIYPRSFADANGDGIGDLAGITSRIPYLKELGIDAVWLSPFYPSNLADGGYDVDDYRDVDPKIGTLEEFAEMSQALHAAGIKLVVDIVPNHSSDQHRWFKEAVAAGKGSPERERYIFRDGRGENGDIPPSTWPAMFGGIVWDRVSEPDRTPGQWYFHTFTKEQPDWNWKHPDVHREFLETFEFWAERGVDGFRIDVAHGLTKNLDPAYDVIANLGEPGQYFEEGQHPISDRDDVHAIYKEWRHLFNRYDPPLFAVAEAWVQAHRRAPYASMDELGQAFNFDLLEARFDAKEFKSIVSENLADAKALESSSTWVLSNHDVVRHATRYGLPDHDGRTQSDITGNDWLLSGGKSEGVDLAEGLRKAQAATMFILGLPGSVYMYQGEELGLHEVGDIPACARQDPTFFRSEGREVGRDGCRVPLPWTASEKNFGFSARVGSGGCCAEGGGSGARSVRAGAGGSEGGSAKGGGSAVEPNVAPAHLPQPHWFGKSSVEAEEGDLESTLALYRRAIALRRGLEGPEELTWVDSDPQTLHFVRPGGWHVMTNFGSGPVELPDGEVLLTSQECSIEIRSGELPGHTTVWFRD